MKIVVNRKFNGGFFLSDKTYEKLIEYGIPCIPMIPGNEDEVFLNLDEKVIFTRNDKINSYSSKYFETWLNKIENRNHPLLIKVVEELGDSVNTECSYIRILIIPDDMEWTITAYAGLEIIHDKHCKLY